LEPAQFCFMDGADALIHDFFFIEEKRNEALLFVGRVLSPELDILRGIITKREPKGYSNDQEIRTDLIAFPRAHNPQ
jgi:hypothetical protein